MQRCAPVTTATLGQLIEVLLAQTGWRAARSPEHLRELHGHTLRLLGSLLRECLLTPNWRSISHDTFETRTQSRQSKHIKTRCASMSYISCTRVSCILQRGAVEAAL